MSSTVTKRIQEELKVESENKMNCTPTLRTFSGHS